MINTLIYLTASLSTVIFGYGARTMLSSLMKLSEEEVTSAQKLKLEIIIIVIMLILNFILIVSYIGRFKISNADEWQLLIRDGKLIDGKIGATHFCGVMDTIVRFPSCINKVKFRVETITKEMQGVVVSGFSLWSIHR